MRPPLATPVRGIVAFAALLAIATGCDTSERISRLEKQNQELQSQLSKERAATAGYDLQAKCSKDAKIWFKENSSWDKNTVLLDFTNHYNKKLNKCFILVEYHYDSHFAGPGGTSWTNRMTLEDVYENAEYGEFAENHYTYWKPEFSSHDEVITCKMFNNNCKTIDEFNNFTRPYLND